MKHKKRKSRRRVIGHAVNFLVQCVTNEVRYKPSNEFEEIFRIFMKGTHQISLKEKRKLFRKELVDYLTESKNNEELLTTFWEVPEGIFAKICQKAKCWDFNMRFPDFMSMRINFIDSFVQITYGPERKKITLLAA